jgi:hypothetical protein
MDGMMKWPQAKGIQAAIAFAVALLLAVFVFVQFAMESSITFTSRRTKPTRTPIRTSGLPE